MVGWDMIMQSTTKTEISPKRTNKAAFFILPP